MVGRLFEIESYVLVFMYTYYVKCVVKHCFRKPMAALTLVLDTLIGWITILLKSQTFFKNWSEAGKNADYFDIF